MTKRILIIASYATSLITFRFDLIKALVAEGYEVITCAPADPANKEVANRLAEINAKFIVMPLKRTGVNLLLDLFFFYKLIGLIKSLKLSAVLSYTMKPVVYGSLAAKICGTKKIYSMVTGLGYVFTNQGIKSSLLRKLIAPLLKVAIKYNYRVFFHNKDNLNEFCTLGILKNLNQAQVINGSGVNLDEFVPTPYPPTIVFILVARMLVNKGIREYIAAASIIKKQHPEAKFLLVGWIDENPDSISKDELQSWINSSIIEYQGRLTDVRPAIAQASVFVLPSYGEGTPRSVLEAMAMSRPIITTDVPGCRETVIEGKNGFLVPPKDNLKLAAAMLRFINEPSLIAIMGSESRCIAEHKYDVIKVNQVIINSMEGKF